MNKLKLGFIGGSNQSIAGRPHFIASRMDNRFEVVAGAFSSNEEVNQRTASDWGVSNVYSDWRVLIESQKSNIDAVVVLTPTPLHKEVVIAAIKAEIPVICEKPLVTSLDELREIESIYNPNNHYLAVTNNYSGFPMVRELRAMIQKGDIGRVLHTRLEMPQESFMRPPKNVKYPQKWRLKDGFVPMISLDLGTHLDHLARFITNIEPTQVQANYSRFSKYGVVDDVNILTRAKDNTTTNMWLSKTSLGYRNGLEVRVFGDQGAIFWKQSSPEYIEFSKTNGEKRVIDRGGDLSVARVSDFNRMTPGHPSGFIEAFANLYGDIHFQLTAFKHGERTKSDYVFGLAHAKQGIELLHCASISNEEGTWVDLSVAKNWKNRHADLE